MSDFNDYHFVIQDYINSPGARYYEPYWWDKEIEQFSKDVAISIQFVKTECTDEEIYYLSEVFEEILQKTKSYEFLQCIRERAELVENSEWKEDIISCIEEAVEMAEMD